MTNFCDSRCFCALYGGQKSRYTLPGLSSCNTEDRSTLNNNSQQFTKRSKYFTVWCDVLNFKAVPRWIINFSPSKKQPKQKKRTTLSGCQGTS